MAHLPLRHYDATLDANFIIMTMSEVRSCVEKEMEDLGITPNSPYDHCGRKATVKKIHMTSHDVPKRVIYDFVGSLSVVTTRIIMRLLCSKIVTNKHHCLVDPFIVSFCVFARLF